MAGRPKKCTAGEIIAFIHRMAKEMDDTPSRDEFMQHPNRPVSISTIEVMFGGWRGAIRAAELKPRPTRRKGDIKAVNIDAIDEVLREEFPGWAPGNDSATYRRSLDELRVGLLARPITGPIYNWHTQEYDDQLERYELI